MNTRIRLLSREGFTEGVKSRAHGTCVCCVAPAVDAHHILERKLWPDDGYYLDNGAALCAHHHWLAETTEMFVEEIRQAAGVTTVLPPGFSLGLRYDKWGNVVRADGLREAGPLFHDTGCRKALGAAGLLGRFVPAGTPLCITDGDMR